MQCGYGSRSPRPNQFPNLYPDYDLWVYLRLPTTQAKAKTKPDPQPGPSKLSNTKSFLGPNQTQAHTPDQNWKGPVGPNRKRRLDYLAFHVPNNLSTRLLDSFRIMWKMPHVTMAAFVGHVHPTSSLAKDAIATGIFVEVPSHQNLLSFVGRSCFSPGPHRRTTGISILLIHHQPPEIRKAYKHQNQSQKRRRRNAYSYRGRRRLKPPRGFQERTIALLAFKQ